MKILIWGTGENAQKYLKKREIPADEIIGFVESRPESQEYQCESYGRYRIYAPSDIKELAYDFMLICVWHKEAVEEITETCIKFDLLDSRAVFIRNIRCVTSEGEDCCYNRHQDNESIGRIFPVFSSLFLERKEESDKVFSARTNEDVLHDSFLQTPDFCDYTRDYFRYRTFEFAAEEIKRNNVKGDVAEVGVSTGTFSRLINAVFSDRTLYMFDTFDSFDRQEFEDDISIASENEDFYDLYKNIDVENVIQAMPHKEKCFVKIGLFPGTTAGLEDHTYAFVSIDVDLEKSIYNSLEYFYPRLNQGGYLFVHDYRCHDLEGVKKAVLQYEDTHGKIYKVPIADRGGTLIIMK